MERRNRTGIRVGRDGQTIVEFALILMLLLVVLFGIMEFARAWQYSNALTNGVRDGAKYASALANTTAFETKVKNYTFRAISSSLGDMPWEGFGPDNVEVIPPVFVSNTLITVRATYQLDIVTWRLFDFFSETQKGPELRRSATMRMQQ